MICSVPCKVSALVCEVLASACLRAQTQPSQLHVLPMPQHAACAPSAAGQHTRIACTPSLPASACPSDDHCARNTCRRALRQHSASPQHDPWPPVHTQCFSTASRTGPQVNSPWAKRASLPNDCYASNQTSAHCVHARKLVLKPFFNTSKTLKLWGRNLTRLWSHALLREQSGSRRGRGPGCI